MKINHLKRIVVLATFFAIVATMTFVPYVGIISIPALGVGLTLLLIPIVLASVSFGLLEGVLVGAFFGVMSLVYSFVMPQSIIDLMFQNPLVSVLPRLALGFVCFFSFSFFKKVFRNSKSVFCQKNMPFYIATYFTVLTNTILVVGMLLLFNSDSALLVAILPTIAINFAIEIVTTNLVALPIFIALEKSGLSGRQLHLKHEFSLNADENGDESVCSNDEGVCSDDDAVCSSE